MASHGVPRPSAPQQKSAEAREKELKEIVEYRSLVDDVSRKVDSKDFSPELLQQTAALLNKNPEYYTMWNIRRRIYVNEFEQLSEAVTKGEISESNEQSQILQIIQLDLQFLFPLLLKFPKCYWIWNHRIWLLEQSSSLLPPGQARKIWEDELSLVGKMLARDNRNYHGWGYRRFVVQNLESSDLGGISMARKEHEYTTKMVKNNLSNFSAWHNRANLIIRMLDEESANFTERRDIFESELEFIHKALFDPYDQSLWFYHQNLMCTLDPNWNAKSMLPNLSIADRLMYLENERNFIRELLEDADDCKWAYQALIECSMIEGQLKGGLTPNVRTDIQSWLRELKKLDPLRSGRWLDIEAAMK